MPSLVAVIVLLPAAIADTAPLVLTVAMLGFELVHAITRPVKTLPFESFRVAVAWVPLPTASVVAPKATLTEATAAAEDATATPATPVLPSLVALIVAEPAATPVTTPDEEMDA